jgi:hypothetical protein
MDNEALHNLYSSPNIIRMIRSEDRGPHSTRRELLACVNMSSTLRGTCLPRSVVHVPCSVSHVPRSAALNAAKLSHEMTGKTLMIRAWMDERLVTPVANSLQNPTLSSMVF